MFYDFVPFEIAGTAGQHLRTVTPTGLWCTSTTTNASPGSYVLSGYATSMVTATPPAPSPAPAAPAARSVEQHFDRIAARPAPARRRRRAPGRRRTRRWTASRSRPAAARPTCRRRVRRAARAGSPRGRRRSGTRAPMRAAPPRAATARAPPSPPSRHSIGRMNASKTISDEVGNPGMPTTGLPPARANRVGLPGRMSMPWNRMPGGRGRPARRPDTSFVPIDEPPDRITASWSASSARDRAPQRVRVVARRCRRA